MWENLWDVAPAKRTRAVSSRPVQVKEEGPGGGGVRTSGEGVMDASEPRVRDERSDKLSTLMKQRLEANEVPHLLSRDFPKPGVAQF